MSNSLFIYLLVINISRKHLLCNLFQIVIKFLFILLSSVKLLANHAQRNIIKYIVVLYNQWYYILSLKQATNNTYRYVSNATIFSLIRFLKLLALHESDEESMCHVLVLQPSKNLLDGRAQLKNQNSIIDGEGNVDLRIFRIQCVHISTISRYFFQIGLGSHNLYFQEDFVSI